MRRYISGGLIAVAMAFPAKADAQVNCANPMLDALLPQLLQSATQAGDVGTAFPDVTNMIGMLDQLGGMSGDACLQRTVALLKAISYVLARRMSDAETIFAEELPPPGDPRNMDIVELLAQASRAALYSFRRNDDAARALVQLLLPEFRRRFGASNPMTLALEGSLGDIKLAARDYEGALEVFEAVAGRGGLVPDHPLRCVAMVNRAHALLGAGLIDAARALLAEIRAPETMSCARLRNAGSPWIGRADWLWGALLLSEQDSKGAIAALEQAYSNATSHFGKTHPQSLRALFSLAEGYAVAGQADEAVARVTQLNAELKTWLGQEIVGSTARDARSRLVRDQDRLLELSILVALKFPDHAAAQVAAADAVLKFKAIQLEEQAELGRLLRSDTVSASVRAQADKVRDLRVKLSEAVHVGVGQSAAPGRAEIDRLTASLEAAEAKLASVSDYFQHRRVLSAAPAQQLRDTLASSGVLVEYVTIAARSLGDLGWMAPADAQPKLYAAIRIDKTAVRVAGLGSEKTVNALITPLRDPYISYLAREGSDVERAANSEILARTQRELYRLLVAPLDLEGHSDILLAPTATLSVAQPLSFRTRDGRYWIENEAQTFQLVHSGRALLKEEKAAQSKSGVVGFGGVDFGAEDGRGFLEQSLIAAEKAAELFAERSGNPSVVLSGAEATERKLRDLAGEADVLYLATHGFYNMPEREISSEKFGALSEGMQPLLSSGLMLAGANSGGFGGDDGVMHAIEIQDLDLDGASLVFLLACETGNGEVDGLEGVHGLARAFTIAGADNFVAALREIDQTHARAFSDVFFDQWNKSAGVSAKAAYLAAVRKIISDGDKIDWTAFVHFTG